MIVHQTSHKPRLWQQTPRWMFLFITLRVPEYFDRGRHISQEKKKIFFVTGCCFFSGLWKILESIIVRPPTLIDVIKGV